VVIQNSTPIVSANILLAKSMHTFLFYQEVFLQLFVRFIEHLNKVMTIEVHQELEEVYFISDKKVIKERTRVRTIDTSRDFYYEANKNALNEGIFNLTIYIIHQDRATQKVLLSYIGLVKAFLMDLGNESNDRIELFNFIDASMKKAWQYVSEKEPELKIVLKNKVDTASLCDKVIISLKNLGFYK
jgi:hypothetical protein